MPDNPPVPDDGIKMSKSPVPDKDDDSQLQVLKRQLYARDEPAELAQRTKRLSQVPAQQGQPYGEVAAKAGTPFTDALARRTAQRRRTLRWALVVGIIVLAFAAAVGGTLWYRSAHQVRSGDIGLTLAGPEAATSGENITYTVTFENKSLENWQQVQVGFEAPSGWRLEGSEPEVRPDGPGYVYDAGELAAGARGELFIRGILIGEQNASLLSKATITFAPANDPKGARTATATLTTIIRAVPLEVSIEASKDAASGERLLGVVHVKNISSAAQQNVYLALHVPAGMQLSTQDPQFSADFSVPDARWNLPALEPLDEIVRTIVFYVDGATGENRSLEVEVGVKEGERQFVQRTVSHVVAIAGSEVALEQEYGGQGGDQVVTAGQKISGKITFRNTGNVGLKSVVVKLAFEGTGLDPAKLQLKGGAYNPTTKTITWTSATVPALTVLNPNQTGEITYDLAVLPTAQFPTATGGGVNNAIVATATIDSPDIATALGQERRVVTDRTVLSVATDLTAEAIAFYDDGRLNIPSTGPLPPNVGEQTTYTLRFRLGSTLNDVGDVRLAAVLPDGVAYTDKTYKTTGEVTYNERTGEVIWHIPLMKGLTGRAAPAEDLHVQVAITPGENKRGESIELLQSVKAEATDEFVDQPVSVSVDKLPTTETASPGKGKVQ